MEEEKKKKKRNTTLHLTGFYYWITQTYNTYKNILVNTVLVFCSPLNIFKGI